MMRYVGPLLIGIGVLMIALAQTYKAGQSSHPDQLTVWCANGHSYKNVDTMMVSNDKIVLFTHNEDRFNQVALDANITCSGRVQ